MTAAVLDIRSKVVVITGAGRGIGQQFARSLAAAGASIVAADINDCSTTLDFLRAEGTSGSTSGWTPETPVPPWTWSPQLAGSSDALTR